MAPSCGVCAQVKMAVPGLDPEKAGKLL